jgi:hypothetical protein
MPFIYLNEFNFTHYVLQYDLITGEYEKILSIQIPSARQTAKGFYVETNDHTAGVHASPEGPVLFCDNQRFRLSLHTHQAVINQTENPKEQEFVFFENKAERLRLFYKPEHIPQGLMAEVDTVCFVWLAQNLDDPAFFESYTGDYDMPPSSWYNLQDT